MTVNVIIITHGSAGKILSDSAKLTLDLNQPNNIQINTFDIKAYTDLDLFEATLVSSINQLNTGDGVLVLTDLYGATPSNIAKRIKHELNTPIEIVTGLNLPMLLRVLNYADESLVNLADIAVKGGISAIKKVED